MNNILIQHNDELSILELIKIFWQRRKLILIITLLCFCLSVAYLFFRKPSYEANAWVAPPIALDLSRFNAVALHSSQDSSLKIYSVEDIYSIYVKRLLSESTKRSFFEKIYLPVDDKDMNAKDKEFAYQKFRKMLKIKEDAREKAKYQVSVASYSPQKASKLLNAYMQYVYDGFIADIKVIFNNQIKSQLLNIDLELTSIQQLSQKYLVNELRNLQLSLTEAEVENMDHFLRAREDYFSAFMLGTKILKVRMEALKKQKIAPSLMQKYLTLKVDRNFYSTIANGFFSEAQFNAFNFTAYPSYSSMEPSAQRIILMGLLAGLILGSMVVAFVAVTINHNSRNLEFSHLRG